MLVERGERYKSRSCLGVRTSRNSDVNRVCSRMKLIATLMLALDILIYATTPCATAAA